VVGLLVATTAPPGPRRDAEADEAQAALVPEASRLG